MEKLYPQHKALFIFFSLLVILALAAGFFWLPLGEHATTTGTPYSGPVEKIRIGNIGEFSIFNLIAKENGYFRDNGLDAEIQEHDAGPSAMADLLAGKSDVAVAADFVGVSNIFKNSDLRIIAQASKHQVFQVIARKDHGIIDPADLKGKKIGVTRKSAGEFYLGRFLTFNDLLFPDVSIIDLPPLEIVRQFEDGTIDAAIIFDPHAYNLQKKLGDSVIMWSAQREQKNTAIVYSTNTFIQAHPDIVERYLNSLVAAEQYFKTNTVEAKAFIEKTLGRDSAFMEYSWPNFDHTIALDQELLLSMEDEARWMIEQKLTDKTKVPNYLDFMYFSALESVKPGSITVIH